MEPLGGRVVRAGRADDIEPLEPQLLLQRAQRVDLAGNADHREPPEAARARRLQQRQQRRVAHPHAAALRHAGGLGHQHRHRAPVVGGVGRHGQHRVDRAGLQQALGDPRGDAGPLRARARPREGGAQHAAERAEVLLVGAGGIARRPCTRASSAGIIRLDELAGLAAAFRLGAAGDAAIGAKPPPDGRGQRRRPDGRGGGGLGDGLRHVHCSTKRHGRAEEVVGARAPFDSPRRGLNGRTRPRGGVKQSKKFTRRRRDEEK